MTRQGIPLPGHRQRGWEELRLRPCVATAIPPGDHTGETGTEEQHRRRFGDGGRCSRHFDSKRDRFCYSGARTNNVRVWILQERNDEADLRRIQQVWRQSTEEHLGCCG